MKLTNFIATLKAAIRSKAITGAAVAAVAGSAMLAAAPAAQAQRVYFGVGFGPRYVAPAPAYYGPRPYYVEPAPTVVFGGPAYGYGYWDHWHRWHRDYGWHRGWDGRWHR